MKAVTVNIFKTRRTIYIVALGITLGSFCSNQLAAGWPSQQALDKLDADMEASRARMEKLKAMAQEARAKQDSEMKPELQAALEAAQAALGAKQRQAASCADKVSMPGISTSCDAVDSAIEKIQHQIQIIKDRLRSLQQG